jgi:hypothetical protein
MKRDFLIIILNEEGLLIIILNKEGLFYNYIK